MTSVSTVYDAYVDAECYVTGHGATEDILDGEIVKWFHLRMGLVIAVMSFGVYIEDRIRGTLLHDYLLWTLQQHGGAMVSYFYYCY